MRGTGGTLTGHGKVVPNTTPHQLDQVAVAGMIQRGHVFQINDLADTDAYPERRSIPVASVEIGRVRSAVYAPLMKDYRVLGVIVLFRQEVREFHRQTDRIVVEFRGASGHRDRKCPAHQ